MNTHAEVKDKTTQTPVTITERDKRYLEKMIQDIRRSGRKEESLDALSKEINRANIVISDALSSKVVTMGSLVSIVDLDTSERSQYRLIFPDKSKGEDNEISVLSPIGTGILGYQLDDVVEWEVPAGTRRFKIVKVDYQPDAANTYHL